MLDAPALVIGSLPPEGNDLDLLVPPDQEHTLASILAGAGFVRHAVSPFPGYPNGFAIWARFRDCHAEAVDAIPLANLELPPQEVERLFAEARPIPGFTRLVRPSPHHVLLILSHNFLAPADGRTPLPAGRRRRVEQVLAEDPLARERARDLAPAWRRPERLARLDAAFALRDTGTADSRQPPNAGSLARKRLRWLRAYRRAWRHGHVVAFSGPDAEGRRVQAEGLARALQALDIPARVEPVAPAVDEAATAARRELGDRGRARTRRWLRDASAPVAHLRAGGRALRHAAEQRRAVLPGLWAGDVVICDGYTLDAAVGLRARYGERWRFGVQTALIRALTPRPRRAYLIDRRPPEATIYSEPCAALGVQAVDGARPSAEICAEIAVDVWRAVR
jgi:hypothetical protein